MKNIGVVRRIDELGRIVIPKEIRKTLRIKENDNLDIYVDNNENIILKKYSLISSLTDFAQQFTDAIYNFLKKNIMITDKSTIIAYSGEDKKRYIGKNISKDLETSLDRRENILEKFEKEISFSELNKENCKYIIISIISNGDVMGLVVVFSNDELNENDYKISKIAAQFLGKYLEQ